MLDKNLFTDSGDNLTLGSLNELTAVEPVTQTVELTFRPTTETLLDALKKDEFNTFIQNLTLFTQLYPGQPLPIEAQELYEMMGEVYGFDVDNIQGSTETKKRRQKVNEMISALQGMNPANIL